MKPIIEDISQEKQDEARKIIGSDPSHWYANKHTEINQITGICCICGKIASKLVKYKLEDEDGVIIRVQRYCEEHFNKEKWVEDKQ